MDNGCELVAHRRGRPRRRHDPHIPNRTLAESSEADQKTRLTGANAPTWTLKLPFLTGIGWPIGRPRRSTGCTFLAADSSGRLTLTVPDWPACSQRRRTVPGPSGLVP